LGGWAEGAAPATVRRPRRGAIDPVGTTAGSGPLPSGAVRRATVVLIALRVVYAYNWYNIGPALPAIGSAFAVGPAEFGILGAAFLVGAGALQVPAGLLARRWGPRRVSILGAGLLAVAGIASGFSPTYDALVAFRLAAGCGAALFFSPAIGLVASLYPPGRRGLPVGTFSSAFSLGSALGLLGTSLLIGPVGWRGSLEVGGVLLGVLTLVALVAIPASAGAASTAPRTPGVPASLRYRGVWAVGLAFIGIEGATFATGQFIVPWGEVVHDWAPLLAGLVAIAFVLPSLFGGPVGGPIAERFRNHRTQFLLAVGMSAGVLALLPFVGLAAVVAIGIVFAFGYGVVYAGMYVLPHFWKEVPGDEVPLAIGLFNAMQLAGGAAVLFLFGAVAAATSYALAWEVLAVLTVGTLVALVALPPTPAVGPAVGASDARPTAPAR